MPKSSSSRWTPAARIWRSLCRDAGLLVVEDDGFDDFERKLLGGRPAAGQRLEQERVEIGLAQLGARDVDGEPAEGDAGAMPFGGLGDRLADDDAADLRAISPAFSGDRDELGRARSCRARAATSGPVPRRR